MRYNNFFHLCEKKTFFLTKSYDSIWFFCGLKLIVTRKLFEVGWGAAMGDHLGPLYLVSCTGFLYGGGDRSTLCRSYDAAGSVN